MRTRKWIMTTMMAIATVGMLPNSARAGDLTPSGGPGSTMHTLEELYQKLLNLEQRQGAVELQMAPSGMVLIPGGTNAGTEPELGAYSLTNAAAFYMDKYEVTKAQWDAVRTWGVAHGYTDLATGGGKAANHPVQQVNWYDCVKWCNARSEKEGREAAYYTDAVYASVYKTGTVSGVSAPYVKASANGYRLPTDVQWEYAARAGLSSQRFPWGANINHSHANYRANGSAYTYDTSPYTDATYHPDYDIISSPYTSPSGAFAANEYGLYDMAGNVWEWCYDWHPSYVGLARVERGGSWNRDAYDCRVAIRNCDNPGVVAPRIGFRAVLPPGQ